MRKKLRFPKNFLWGVATAAYQIEGGNHYSDWWEFERSGKIKDKSSSDAGPNSYDKFNQDLKLLKRLNVNAYRFSIEWGRIEPEPGCWNREGIGYYKKVLTGLRENRIKSLVGLNHLTLPQWVAEEGGWENEKIVEWQARYTKLICQKLGQWVDFWITINEPQTTLLTGYLIGYWPPEKKNLTAAFKVVRNINKSHRRMYEVIHGHAPGAKVGMVNILPAFRPLDTSLPNRLLSKCLFNLNLRMFVKPNVKYSDFIGLNYYLGPKVKLVLCKRKSRLFSKNNQGFPGASLMRFKLLGFFPLWIAVDLKGKSEIISD